MQRHTPFSLLHPLPTPPHTPRHATHPIRMPHLPSVALQALSGAGIDWRQLVLHSSVPALRSAPLGSLQAGVRSITEEMDGRFKELDASRGVGGGGAGGREGGGEDGKGVKREEDEDEDEEMRPLSLTAAAGGGGADVAAGGGVGGSSLGEGGHALGRDHLPVCAVSAEKGPAWVECFLGNTQWVST